MLELVESGKAYVKLSAPYRCTTATDYADMEPLARRFIRCNPQRMLWGSDWPHPQPGVSRTPTMISPPHRVDNGHVLDQLRQWSQDETILRTILVDNPVRLYGFSG